MTQISMLYKKYMEYHKPTVCLSISVCANAVMSRVTLKFVTIYIRVGNTTFKRLFKMIYLFLLFFYSGKNT